MTIFPTLKFILAHPLNRRRQLAAARDFLAWQIGSRLVPGAVAVPFVNGARLLASPGMTGATGNVYAGLHEFEDMAFALHLLRPEDLFVDVGANIGSYTVLAGAAAGARCAAFEPLPGTFQHLLDNIRLNGLDGRVRAHNLGVGAAAGLRRFTAGLDTVNHVASTAEALAGGTVEVGVVTLDQALDGLSPKLVKIDVEGFEAEVIAGAGRVLADPELDAVIMELNGSGRRYGFDEVAIHRQMLGHGFSTFAYAPFERALTALGGTNPRAGNTLYVRNPGRVQARLADAPKFHVLGQDI